MITLKLSDLDTKSQIASLAKQVVNAKKVIVIVGAGISTDAGIQVQPSDTVVDAVVNSGLTGFPVSNWVEY